MELDQRSLLEEAADAGVLAYLMKPVREFEHKIRDKLEANAPVSEVTELIARAHELIKRAIEVISR